ncbi:hypothetical protein DL96DRAFT_1277506 [Flagelloscypha sp. PMI_526]|nr:hypothetical protein DL96DRAFT_1277506 [Flagelloscypha sp. PMI_526]
MALPYNPDSPYFPQELEELIFTFCAESSIGKDVGSLRLVCCRAKTWVEPFRFRVLSLTWFETLSTRQEYRDLLLSLPPEVLSRTVQRIWMGTPGSHDFNIISRCRGITHFALARMEYGVPDLTVYAHLQRLSLTHRSANGLLSRMRYPPMHKLFPSLTHFQVFGSSIQDLDADWIGDFHQLMPQFPALSHFMLEYVASLGGADWKDLRSIASLDQIVVMVILKCPPPPSSSQRQEPLDSIFVRHDKVVVLDWECGRMRQEWDHSCTGKADAWDEAEYIMKKRLEEN